MTQRQVFPALASPSSALRILVLSLVMAGLLVGVADLHGQQVDEGMEEKASSFLNYFGFQDPIYFAFGEGMPPGATENLTFAKFQVSFRFELIDFYAGERKQGQPARGINVAYTQTSIWDLESNSQPFFDSSYKPGAFLLYQDIGNGNLSLFDRFDIEGGYQHHSNGNGGVDSRHIDILYLKPTFGWRLFEMSYFFVSPKLWTYLTKSALNEDIADWWGYLDLELTWRADFGLQVETHTMPAKEITTFNAQLTYPLSNLWRPLNFYAFVDYWNGAGETILRYDATGSGWIFGISFSR
jgi:outer membrane phospholipase A